MITLVTVAPAHLSARIAEPAVARDGADQAVQTPASAPATAPVLTADEEAEAAIAMINQGRAAEAMPIAESAYRRMVRPGVPLLAMGLGLDATSRGFEALGYLKKYAELPSGRNDWRVHAAIGSIYQRAGYAKVALQSLQEAEKLVPRNSPGGIINIANSLVEAYLEVDKELPEADRKSRARESLRRAAVVVNDARNARVWMAYGPTLWRLEGYNDEVEVALRSAVGAANTALQRAAPTDHFAVDDVLAAFEIYDGVLRNELAAIKTMVESGENVDQTRVDRRSELILQSVGIAVDPGRISAMGRRQYLDAYSILDDAIKVEPESVKLRMTQASILVQLGDRDGAIAMLKSVLDIDPGNTIAQNALIEVQKAPAASQAAASAPSPQPQAGSN